MTELATQRLLQFVGDPGTERVRGSHITGTCCCCSKALTDRISLERGIGPECVCYVTVPRPLGRASSVRGLPAGKVIGVALLRILQR